MRRHKQVRLVLESMESKLLLTAQALSGLAPVAMVSPMPLPPISIHTLELNGAAHGSYHQITKNPDVGTRYDFFGSGRVSGLGHTAITGHIDKVGFIAVGPPTGMLYLSDARGTVTLKITGAGQNGPSGLPTLFTFKVVGGTGAFRHDTGGGNLTLDLTPGHGKSSAAIVTGGHFSMNVYSTPTPVATS